MSNFVLERISSRGDRRVFDTDDGTIIQNGKSIAKGQIDRGFFEIGEGAVSALYRGDDDLVWLQVGHRKLHFTCEASIRAPFSGKNVRLLVSDGIQTIEFEYVRDDFEDWFATDPTVHVEDALLTDWAYFLKYVAENAPSLRGLGRATGDPLT